MSEQQKIAAAIQAIKASAFDEIVTKGKEVAQYKAAIAQLHELLGGICTKLDCELKDLPLAVDRLIAIQKPVMEEPVPD